LFSEEDVRDIRKEYGWDDKFVVLYIGAHGVANNLEQLIFAAEKLKEALSDVLFVLIGDGMEKPKLVKMVKEKGLDNVIFIPPQPKERIKDFVYAADVGIAVLKRVDVFKTVYPNKVFDYMCCKKPVILGIDGIARKLVVDEAKCGIYYEPENIDMLVDAVKMYYNDEKLRKEHGENGYRFVKANFDRKVLAKKYIDEIKAILTRP
jgi:glycosyltransferase involved in cell wall biosynthesis